MNRALGSTELQLFQAAIAAKVGLRFDDSKLTFLAEVLGRRLAARDVDAAAYLTALANDAEGDDELRALGRELTVGETYFFRHSEQFNALCGVVFPERMAVRAPLRALRLLSVGCATGEEPYTFAILARQQALEPAYQVSITGIDLNRDSLDHARRGVYSTWSLRETPAEVRERWFTPHERSFRLAPELREAVRFHEHNLVRPHAELFAPDTYDVIFCRNVLMYFTPERMAEIVQRLTAALAPGGYLFLGHAETLRGLSQSFHLCHTHGTFYYQRKDALARAPEAAWQSGPGTTAGSTAAMGGGWVDNWLQSVERSADRICTLSDGHPEHAASDDLTTAAAPTAGRRDLQEPMALLASERFSEALASLQTSAADDGADPTALLLRAALLTHQGELATAEATCRELLELDELNAGAHYLLALCFERREQLAVAAEHARTAIYLDAGFAMPHLHLGLMARRSRDVEGARRELGQALWLLEREDPARLLLFGGGFTRSALLKLCRSELENLRGAP
ncbi:MAG TPA: CheR family methyltransferase [Polyangiaceae bacterium]|nr:CheR family methyltransferase [Polyangiaceae bacterium]